MIWFTSKLTKKFSLDVIMFSKYQHFTDGVTFFNLNFSMDLYDGDHKPSIDFQFCVLNFNILSFNIYNVNHLTESTIE